MPSPEYVGKVDVPAGSAVLAVWHAGKCYVVEATAAQIGEAGLPACLVTLMSQMARTLAGAEGNEGQTVQ